MKNLRVVDACRNCKHMSKRVEHDGDVFCYCEKDKDQPEHFVLAWMEWSRKHMVEEYNICDDWEKK